MEKWFWLYIISFFEGIPGNVCIGLLIFFCIGLVLILSYNGLRERTRMFWVLLLFVYILLLFCSMVIFRADSMNFERHNFQLFWSYKAIMIGRNDLIVENLMNVLAFLPVGVLLELAFRSMNWRKTVILGLFLSLVIEILQFMFKKGFSELDDVMHNTFGCILGYGFCWFITKIYRKITV